MSFHDLVNEQRIRDRDRFPAHLAGTLDASLLSDGATFGASEPTYFELLGPEGVLKLRATKNPTAMLFGSYGHYSSDEFARFMRKINPGAETHVIDPSDESHKYIRERGEKIKDHVAINGDSRSLQYPDETFDLICTNHLFNFLQVDTEGRPIHTHERLEEAGIFAVFTSAYAALKPGGTMLITERPYGIYTERDKDGSISRNRILQIAKRAGFKVARVLPNSMVTPLAKERGKVTISKGGFPDYTNVAVQIENATQSIRLIK